MANEQDQSRVDESGAAQSPAGSTAPRAGGPQHTPGPWTVLNDRIAAPCHEHPNCEKTIAWLGLDGVLRCSHNGNRRYDDNAHLIAAAPLLLAVAQVVDADVRAGEPCPVCAHSPHFALCALVSALAKAEGK